MATDTIFLWFNQYLNGDISIENSKQLEAWLAESAANKRLFDQVKAMWEVTGQVSLDLDLDLDEAWEQTRAKITLQKSTSTPTFKLGWWYKAAAAVLVVAITGAIFFFYNTTKRHVYETIAQQTKLVQLPDGSQVWLNENSNLAFLQGFSKDHRTLDLEGEAFFEVTKDLQLPFVVRTNTLNSTVLGTSFHVRSIQSQDVSEVTVVTGKVGVTINDGDNMTLLTPGTKIQYDTRTKVLQKSSNEDPNFLAWRNKKLIFENTPLVEIQEALEEYYHVQIHIDNMDIATCQLTSNFDDPTLEEVLEVIALTLDLEYTKEGASYRITGEGCNVQ